MRDIIVGKFVHKKLRAAGDIIWERWYFIDEILYFRLARLDFVWWYEYFAKDMLMLI